MKLKIHKPVEESVVTLRPVENADGSVTIEDENDWSLVTFEADGTITLHGDIGDESGFKLDEQGRIRTAKD